MSDVVSIPLRYGRLGWLFGVMGLGRRYSRLLIDDANVVVRMGWAFHAVVPRDAIRSAVIEDRNVWWAIGVHFVGRRVWLVNGSSRGVVWMDLDRNVRARTMGIPISVRRLGVSVEDPQQFVAALARQP